MHVIYAASKATAHSIIRVPGSEMPLATATATMAGLQRAPRICITHTALFSRGLWLKSGRRAVRSEAEVRHSGALPPLTDTSVGSVWPSAAVTYLIPRLHLQLRQTERSRQVGPVRRRQILLRVEPTFQAHQLQLGEHGPVAADLARGRSRPAGALAGHVRPGLRVGRGRRPRRRARLAALRRWREVTMAWRLKQSGCRGRAARLLLRRLRRWMRLVVSGERRGGWQRIMVDATWTGEH